MRGVIRKRDVIAHPLVTIRCFGWRVFFRTLAAGRERTFLSLVAEAGLVESPRVQVPDILERCIRLELRAKRLYEALAERFSGEPEARAFFTDLAGEEEEHAEMLDLCRAAHGRTRREANVLDRFAESLPRLEKGMQDAESCLARTGALPDALRLVLRVESSEVNGVFQGVLASSGPGLVKALRSFQTAARRHLRGIRCRVIELDPSLEDDCRALDACPCPPASHTAP